MQQTTEMDDLEKVKVFYTYKARLMELKIQRLKSLETLKKIESEQDKIKKHLDAMGQIIKED
jgi:hypothetical protein